ncbi:hypothetical protein Y1Q_0015971 [Alligator mississippiensis]|uniref:Uncharacterized protein n=1 Tax=Alligator mississippiensis TaxID=8496 RepID=A0A151MV54_ALLMI|nr:hypothetical protein Y1Q_0015971 [Alligator mississippiensis]
MQARWLRSCLILRIGDLWGWSLGVARVAQKAAGETPSCWEGEMEAAGMRRAREPTEEQRDASKQGQDASGESWMVESSGEEQNAVREKQDASGEPQAVKLVLEAHSASMYCSINILFQWINNSDINMLLFFAVTGHLPTYLFYKQ